MRSARSVAICALCFRTFRGAPFLAAVLIRAEGQDRQGAAMLALGGRELPVLAVPRGEQVARLLARETAALQERHRILLFSHRRLPGFRSAPNLALQRLDGLALGLLPQALPGLARLRAGPVYLVRHATNRARVGREVNLNDKRFGLLQTSKLCADECEADFAPLLAPAGAAGPRPRVGGR